MKLKHFVGAVALAGAMGSVAIAAPAQNNVPTIYGDGDVWNNIIEKAQDNAFGVVPLQEGQTAVTGAIYTNFAYTSKQTGYNDTSGNSAYGFSLSDSELYVDSQLNPWIRAHVVAAVQPDFVSGTGASDLFLPEAYVTMYNNSNWYAKVGRQYLNFGSWAHDSISGILTEDFTNSNQTGATVGYVSNMGAYASVSAYNGSAYKNTTAPTNTAYQAHGYSAEVGYMQEMRNQGYNLYADYISNWGDTLNAINYFNTSVTPTNEYLTKEIPAIALHADYHTGPFDVLADYFTTSGSFDTANWAYGSNGRTGLSGATPSAYSLQGSYGFMNMGKANTVTVGYEGTMQAVGFTSFGSGLTTNANYGFPVPKSRMLVGYGVNLSHNVVLQGEYDYDTDYSTSDCSVIGTQGTIGTPVCGTGNTNSTVTARLKVMF
jgi:hypothetical protein